MTATEAMFYQLDVEAARIANGRTYSQDEERRARHAALLEKWPRLW